MIAGVGDDDGEDVAGVGGAAADGDEHRPVLVDESDPQRARKVVRGVHGFDAGCGEGRAGVDRLDVGSGVIGQVQRGVQQAGDADVVDVAAVAECERGGFVLGAGAADLVRQCRRARLALGHGFDRVEDLDVPGAPAEVRAEVGGHARPRERVTLLVDLRLGPHDDAGDAEAALQATACGEGIGERLPLGLVDALERDDRLAFDLVQVALACHGRLAVEQHRAAAALARWRAAVLGRGDVELLAERGEQVGVAPPHRHRGAVDLERHAPHPSRRLGSAGASSSSVTFTVCQTGRRRNAPA